MIDNELKLYELVTRLHNTPWIALDTEADSLHAYPEKICLIQITTPHGDELIDPLASIDLAPLLKALGEHELIMHGADYDLRLFRKHHGFVPEAVFDTMLASRLLGQTQFGLTNLLAQYLNVTLDKGSQKADWAKRPLTERMEEYARTTRIISSRCPTCSIFSLLESSCAPCWNVTRSRAEPLKRASSFVGPRLHAAATCSASSAATM